MHRAVRVLLVWVMVFAMPVQGMAASMMLFCGPSHERMMQGLRLDVSEVASGLASRPGHDQAAHQLGGHDHAAVMDGVADEAVSTDPADGGPGLLSHHGKFTCSACAACCSALALPASFVLPEPASPAQHAGMAPVEPVASHQPDGLDRPPRTHLA